MEEGPKSELGISSIRAEVPPLSPKTKKLSKEEKELYGVQTEGLRQNIHERKRYARRIFILCCCWVSAVFVLLMCQGSGHSWFHLSDAVILAAIGSTTANIIAVFVIVARYLFPDKGEQ